MKKPPSSGVHQISKNTGGEITSYDYDGVGQMTKITLLYSPILGGMTGTRAAAQTVQDTTWQYQYDANGKVMQEMVWLGDMHAHSNGAYSRTCHSGQRRRHPSTPGRISSRHRLSVHT